MSRFTDLARLFASYGLYPLERYNADTPLRVYQGMYSDHYSNEVEKLLNVQDYPAVRRGADLPWWGKGYFHKRKGFRTMIIGPDSKAHDAGSVVFLAQLFNHVKEHDEYRTIVDKFDDRWGFPLHNWSKLQQQFAAWKLNSDYLYITNAAKVYQEGAHGEIDEEKSRELLLAEIELCRPDLIILLGAAPLTLLRSDLDYRTVVESKEYIEINGHKAVVSPYPASNGFGQKNFNTRLKNASQLIAEALGK